MLRCLILRYIINGRSVLESSEKYKEKWKDKRINIPCEILYLVFVYMSGEILKDQKVWDDTGVIEIKATRFFSVL